MSELFEKSIRTLELPAVLEKLAAKAVSQAAKDRCLKLSPSTDAEEERPEPLGIFPNRRISSPASSFSPLCSKAHMTPFG